MTKDLFSNALVPDSILAEIDKTEDEIIRMLSAGEIKIETEETGSALQTEEMLSLKVFIKKKELTESLNNLKRQNVISQQDYQAKLKLIYSN